MFSLSFAILPFACVVFYYIFDYLLFLRHHVVPRREHTPQFRDGCSAVSVASHAHTPHTPHTHTPHTHTHHTHHTHTQSYSAYTKKVIVMGINTIGVGTVKGFAGQELGVV